MSAIAPAARLICSSPQRRYIGLTVAVFPRSSPSHPDQQLWRSPWKQEERHRLTSSPRGEPPVCYVSSEHCYQKPGASWEKGEEQEKERPMVTVKQERSGEEKVETQQTLV